MRVQHVFIKSIPPRIVCFGGGDPQIAQSQSKGEEEPKKQNTAHNGPENIDLFKKSLLDTIYVLLCVYLPRNFSQFVIWISFNFFKGNITCKNTVQCGIGCLHLYRVAPLDCLWGNFFMIPLHPQ